MISWIATALSIMGTIYVALHKNRGQAVYAIANPLWVAVFLQAGDLAPAVLFGFYELTALYGFWNWRKEGVAL